MTRGCDAGPRDGRSSHQHHGGWVGGAELQLGAGVLALAGAGLGAAAGVELGAVPRLAARAPDLLPGGAPLPAGGQPRPPLPPGGQARPPLLRPPAGRLGRPRLLARQPGLGRGGGGGQLGLGGPQPPGLLRAGQAGAAPAEVSLHQPLQAPGGVAPPVPGEASVSRTSTSTNTPLQRLVSCSQEVRQVAAQETVITEKVSRVDCLTIVLAGRWVPRCLVTRPAGQVCKKPRLFIRYIFKIKLEPKVV